MFKGKYRTKINNCRVNTINIKPFGDEKSAFESINNNKILIQLCGENAQMVSCCTSKYNNINE